MKFVMTQAVCEEGLALLRADCEIFIADDGNPANFREALSDADAFIVRIGQCGKEAIENAPHLKVIGRTGVGYDSVDVATATAHGIPVVITPGANNRSVAEHAVAMMFALSKDLIPGHQGTLNGAFMAVRGRGRSFEMLGKTVGFIGFGAIGREAAKICSGIGMQTCAYDPFLDRTAVEKAGSQYFDNYENLMRVCDFVSVHVPLTEQTQNMIGAKQLALMKKSACLINCARGGIVNEMDLAQALNNDIIAGAATDVYMTEPPDLQSPLLQAKNLILSPHSAAQTKEAVINMARRCIEGCQAVLAGRRWQDVANPEVYQHPKWRSRQ